MKANLESVEIVIFDLGGVLLNIDYKATSMEMKKLGFLDFDEHYTQLAQNNLFDQLETGKISEQAFINELKAHVYSQVTPNQIVHAWNKMIGKFPNKKINLLESLNGKRIVMLSNTNVIHWKKVLLEWKNVRQVQIETYFEKIFLSHEIGLRKPHKETFLFVCQNLNVSPEKVLFIDDSPQHIKGANEAGLNTFYYEDETSFFQLFS